MTEEMDSSNEPPNNLLENKNPALQQTTRIKQYPDDSSGPWTVYFRPKSKPLNIIQISKDLVKQYKAVTEIFKVRPNKLRVRVSDLTQANAIVCSELFTREYRVYIPARIVEIDGVVTEAGLTIDDLLSAGVGRFKNPSIQPVKMLECKRLHSMSLDGGNKKYTPSDSFRVTFAGSALPNYIEVSRVRLPVHLFVPRVMNCLNCKQLGHTATHCCNKVRCGKCGENHADDACKTCAEKCLYCGETLHELPSCPAYKLREEEIKRSLKERSERTFAEMLRKTAAADPIPLNPYDTLSSDELDSDDSPEGFLWPILGSLEKEKSFLL
ncbi:uncharacterized protein LOC129728874 [Wyeomyia smithii]|uniref:uncharacterized protein LOC129728874 n=1 Tax=Wyeomyia smithii TaxID=174621 RepID=UPI002467C140|nr:uncharacterized protein LOC129728874 [Wyeomyia smithii]